VFFVHIFSFLAEKLKTAPFWSGFAVFRLLLIYVNTSNSRSSEQQKEKPKIADILYHSITTLTQIPHHHKP
jgi:hypothetical protein